jgi:predicted Holliday junction resolvase-like endonuclease
METLFILLGIILIVLAFLIGKFIGRKVAGEEIKVQRREAINQSRAVLGGQFAENLAPYLPNFPFSPTECRFIGKPVDFLAFRGMDEKNIEEVVFVEVKSGDSILSSQEKKLKEAIERKKVRFLEYRVPKDLTKREEKID